MLTSRAVPWTMVLSRQRQWHWRCLGRTAVLSLRATCGGTLTMELAHALRFSYTSVAQEMCVIRTLWRASVARWTG